MEVSDSNLYHKYMHKSKDIMYNVSTNRSIHKLDTT